MMVKELMKFLQNLDPNMLVVIWHPNGMYSPLPSVEKYNFKTTYWDISDRKDMPLNQEFVKL